MKSYMDVFFSTAHYAKLKGNSPATYYFFFWKSNQKTKCGRFSFYYSFYLRVALLLPFPRQSGNRPQETGAYVGLRLHATTAQDSNMQTMVESK
jgi:hypothetical protein